MDSNVLLFELADDCNITIIPKKHNANKYYCDIACYRPTYILITNSKYLLNKSDLIKIISALNYWMNNPYTEKTNRFITFESKRENLHLEFMPEFDEQTKLISDVLIIVDYDRSTRNHPFHYLAVGYKEVFELSLEKVKTLISKLEQFVYSSY